MRRVLGLSLVVLFAAEMAFAQTDEIQVYDGGLTAKGKLNLTLHNNFTPAGLKSPAFPGALVSDKLLNGVPEWAYGVTDWFEAGLYMPLYSVDNSGGKLDGFKLRTLFTVPHADGRTFFYGMNLEFSYNSKHWDATRFTSEIRPIIGWHLNKLDVIVNPILDTAYDGLKNLDFAPATRAAYHLSEMWALGVEEYADFGPLHQFNPGSQQSHQLYAVVDHSSKFLDVQVGAGFGLTGASDRFTVKVILSRDLN
jgi:hypothetical protein